MMGLMRSIIVLCSLIAVAVAQPAPPKKEEPKKEEKKEEKKEGKPLPPRPDTAVMKLEKAFIADRTNRTKMLAAWDAIIKLENWYFIWRPDDGDGHPRVATIDGKNMVQCFTDREQAIEVAEYNGLDAKSVRGMPVVKAARLITNMASEEITDSVWDLGRIDHAMTMELKQFPFLYNYHLKKKLP